MAFPVQPAAPSGQVRRVGIAGLGRYVPDKVLTNQDLEKIVDTSDEWIVQRTGIRERRIAAEDQFTSTLAIEAAKQARLSHETSQPFVDALFDTRSRRFPHGRDTAAWEAHLRRSTPSAFEEADAAAACAVAPPGACIGLHVRSIRRCAPGSPGTGRLQGVQALTAPTPLSQRATC